MFSMGEQNKNKCKFGGMNHCEADEVREYFTNSKLENESFGQCVNLVWISDTFNATLVKIYCQK